MMMTTANGVTIIDRTASKEETYKGYVIDHTWDITEKGDKVMGSDEYIIYDETLKPLSCYFTSRRETHDYIDLFA